jgi:hypothetical protein
MQNKTYQRIRGLATGFRGKFLAGLQFSPAFGRESISQSINQALTNFLGYAVGFAGDSPGESPAN